MDDTTMMKITAIVCITAIEIANILVWKIDGAILGFVVAVISGLAGYEIGFRTGKQARGEQK